MSVKYHPELIQGSEEWMAARCGLLTASEMKNIITPMLKVADNEKTRTHLYELVAQRITKYVEPHYIGDDMLRGMEDELDAKLLYNKHYAPVSDIGFVTNDKWGFTLGYSPDALVGDDGLIEVKGRRQKYQMETILSGVMPADYMIQVQTGLLVSERKWCDFISYCGGMPMFKTRIEPDEKIQKAIEEAAIIFHGKMDLLIAQYAEKSVGLIPTERRIEQEITV